MNEYSFYVKLTEAEYIALNKKLGEHGREVVSSTAIAEYDLAMSATIYYPGYKPTGKLLISVKAESKEVAKNIAEKWLLTFKQPDWILREAISAADATRTAATYDTWETNKLYEKQFAERGGNPEVGPPHDYLELFPRSPSKPRHQQDQWWRRKKEHNEKDEVGGEGDSPTTTPLMDQSPTNFNAFPATGSLKFSSINNNISVTMTFTDDGLRAVCTWDKDDVPSGMSEEQTLAKIVEFLQNNIPKALASFKNVALENVDLGNRTISVRISKNQ